MTSQHNLNHYFDFVMKLTIDSAKIIRDAIQGGKTIETKAGDWDLVTQYDRKVEEILIDGLAKEFPTHKFIGEETVSSNKHLPDLTEAPTWIIDPIDGTTNFVHSFPHTCISIALAINKELEIGIVYNPVLEQLFTARRGRGAFLNGKSIRSSSVEELASSLICIEASYATIIEIRDIVLGRLEAFVSIAHGIRTLGSAALTLCHVAMGAAEAYHTDNLMPWDVAAGTLIIKEAGGVVIDTNDFAFLAHKHIEYWKVNGLPVVLRNISMPIADQMIGQCLHRMACTLEKTGGKFDVMSPKVLAVGNHKLAQELVKLIKHADTKTYKKRLQSMQAS